MQNNPYRKTTEGNEKKSNTITFIYDYTEKPGRIPVIAPFAYRALFEMKNNISDTTPEIEPVRSQSVSIADKYSLSIQEAAEYYGIGEKRLRRIVAEHYNEPFILEIGTHQRIKRRLFEEFLDQATTI
jgi:hypothetical protein